MKYLFIDIECADGSRGTVCSFGYVIADMDFHVISRNDIIINPGSRFNLTGREGRPDIELAYSKERFLRSRKFDYFYGRIKELVENKEFYVVGHSVGDDVKYLNKSCGRYRLPPFEFSYFDTQKMYREVMGEKQTVSLKNGLLNLGVTEEFRSHQSVEDARATMLLLKALLAKADMDFESFRASNVRCSGKTANGVALWDCAPPKGASANKGGNRLQVLTVHQSQKTKEKRLREEKEENVIRRGRKNNLLFLRYLDFGTPIGAQGNRFLGKKISISMNYEAEHFKEMIEIVGRIKANGGEYSLKASESDIFVSVDSFDENGDLLRCTRAGYVQKAIEDGKDIQIIPLDEFLALLGIGEDELERMEKPDLEYLLDDQYAKPSCDERVV